MLAVRDVLLEADPRVDECIKWQAPTFTYQGNIASFFPRAKKHVSLMFHHGAALPDPTYDATPRPMAQDTANALATRIVSSRIDVPSNVGGLRPNGPWRKFYRTRL